MKRIILAAALAASISTASAKDITITLTDDEQKVAVQLLDQAVRAGGLQVAEPALLLVRKIAQAVQQPAPGSTAPKDAAASSSGR